MMVTNKPKTLIRELSKNWAVMTEILPDRTERHFQMFRVKGEWIQKEEKIGVRNA